jgi:hypothetical protein
MTDLVTCPSCGAQYLAAATMCASCGTILAAELHLAPSEDEVGYDLSDWSADERARLSAALLEERVVCRWEDDEVVVRPADADQVEALIDEIDQVEALGEEADADAGADLLSALYVSSDVLQHDPDANAAIVELLDAAELAADLGPPYGLDRDVWKAIQLRTDALAELLGNQAEGTDVMAAARSLREAVRPLV